MSSLIRRATTIALASAFAVTGATAVIASPAQAAPAVTISKSITLAGVSTGSARLPGSDAPKVIDLNPGNYSLNVCLGNGPCYARTLTIKTPPGTRYHWRCYLDGTGVAYPGVNYKVWCYLDPQDGISPAFSLPIGDGQKFNYALPAGTHTWKSTLDPAF